MPVFFSLNFSEKGIGQKRASVQNEGSFFVLINRLDI